MLSKLKQLLGYYSAQMKAAQTTTAALTVKAELKASKLVQQMDDMTEKMMVCSSAESLVRKTVLMKETVMVCSLVASLAKKSEEMTVRMTGC